MQLFIRKVTDEMIISKIILKNMKNIIELEHYKNPAWRGVLHLAI